MAAYQQKTLATEASVDAFLAAVEPAGRRDDGIALRALMEEVTGEPARMWGPSIVGYGEYAYTYASGHSGVAQRIGFSPRKANLVLYVPGMDGPLAPLLPQLGKHKRGGVCLYLGRLSDVDPAVLRQIIEASWAEMQARYPG